MKKYLVQTRYPDGEVGCGVHTGNQIIDMLGFRDCTDCELEVFDVSKFGKAVKLEEDANISWPHNYHRLKNVETGETVIEGYSQEH